VTLTPHTDPAASLRRANGRRGGFTLIEILLAIGIIGMATGMVLVNFGGVTQTERLRAAARNLAGMSDFIRSQAAGTKDICYFDVDFDHNQYRWRREPMRDELGRFIDPDTGYLLAPNEVTEWREAFEWEPLPRDVYFSRLMFNRQQFQEKGWQQVQYRADGTVSSYILWIGTKEDDVEHMFSIVVNGLTGKSEVLRGSYLPKDADESDFSEVMNSEGGGSSR
jgi:prepilin-type N-terminal cleavage/methylation domain-containing protein